MYSRGINQYQQVNASGAAYADPHRLIQMLFEGALARLAQAKGAIQSEDKITKCAAIDKAFSIVDGLRAGLDMEQGAELAANLDALYDYLQRRLTLANARNDLDALDEVASLLRELKEGWDAIPVEARGVPPQGNGTTG